MSQGVRGRVDQTCASLQRSLEYTHALQVTETTGTVKSRFAVAVAPVDIAASRYKKLDAAGGAELGGNDHRRQWMVAAFVHVAASRNQ